MSTAAVELRDVFRIHRAEMGGVAALQGLTMDVRAGEICVVLGPSGSGKTTLLRLVAGFDRASAGSVRVLGEDLGALPERRLAAYRSRELGYVDQHYSRALARELTACQLVGVQLGLAGLPARERNAVAGDLLDRVGLASAGAALPFELSGGEQQRVAICAALAHRPRLLLADEPTGELDADSSAAVFALVAELARGAGTTALIVSHDPQSVAIADRVVRIRDGRLSGETAGRDGASEAIVIGRGGWLRVPEELLRRAGVGNRATASVGAGGIVLTGAAPVADTASPVSAVESNGDAPGTHPADDGLVAEVREVSKRYTSETRESVPFEGVSAGFRARRLTAVTGPSGSGKTTLLNLLAGLELPSAGEVVVLGRDVASMDREERAALRRDAVGVVGQDILLVPFMSALENVELGLSIRGVPAGKETARAREAIAAVGLEEVEDRPVSELSAGQRSRVAIARAAAERPRLLLVDEPTARLDQANALAVGALFRRLARQTGAAVVCGSHDPLLIELADEELKLG